MAVQARGNIAAAADRMVGCWHALWRCQSGASAVEYAILTIMIAIAVIAGASALGSTLNTKVFQGFADYFASL